MIKSAFTWLGIGLGLISAYYWYRSSVVKVTKNSPNDVIVSNGVEAIPLIATSKELGRLNKIAAALTAASMVCQAIAAAISES